MIRLKSTLIRLSNHLKKESIDTTVSQPAPKYLDTALKNLEEYINTVVVTKDGTNSTKDAKITLVRQNIIKN